MRTYAEDVEVRLRETGAPDDFVWRGRRFGITEVLSTWLERTPWWRTVLISGPGGTPPSSPEGSGTGPCLEDEVWRVEASSGRSGPCGVYDLAHASGRWQLRRVVD